MKNFLLMLIRFYRKNISGLKAYPTCRFYPSCSEYTYGCIEKFGALKGLYLGIKRFLKCNPLFKGGYDPVPEKFSFIAKKLNNSVNKQND